MQALYNRKKTGFHQNIFCDKLIFPFYPIYSISSNLPAHQWQKHSQGTNLPSYHTKPYKQNDVLIHWYSVYNGLSYFQFDPADTLFR